jgi:hypothetical protein
VLAKHLREIIGKDSNPSVMVLRGWLNR